jgi:hypothetical protein
MGDMRVVFIVRCHGKPDENVENSLMDNLAEAVNEPEIGWGILTIGRQYYHDAPLCEGHASADDDFCDYYIQGSEYNPKR